MTKASDQANLLWPHLIKRVEKVARNGGGSGGSGGIGGAPTPHGLSSGHHTGTLADIQAPQFLKSDGTRTLTGNLNVASGVTIDGVDLGAFKVAYDLHVADPDAHHDTATAGNGISIAGGGQVVAVNQAYDFTWTGTHQFNEDPQINANLDFIGGAARSVTAGGQLTIEPTGELWFSPASNLIVSPNDIEWRSQTTGDAPTGISGWRISDDGGNESKLTITRIKADELFVRFFTADETRIFRGEGLWGKSFGIVETDFIVPADEATVDVWFEAIAELPGFDIFEVGDWLLSRDISVTSGLVVQKIWWTVAAAKLADDTTADGIERQQWRIKRESGGLTGAVVHKGSDFLDAGVPTAGSVLGGGIVYLSALAVDGGPFIQTGYFDSVLSDVPQFLYTTRMGNLNGAVDYTDDVFGFAAGNTLGLTPGGGFSGLTADADLGMRLFNTDIELYDATVKVVGISQAGGIELVNDTDLEDNAYTSISWFDDLTSSTGPNTIMTSYANGAGGLTFTVITDGDSGLGTIGLVADGSGGQGVLSVRSDGITMTVDGPIALALAPSDGIRATGRLYPTVDNTYDLGTASLRWRDLYVGALHATTISGTTISGAEWEHSASMVIDANAATNTLVSVANQGAGRADFDVDRNITLGGTVDGVDLAALDGAYAAHIANPAAHHALATGGDGITVTGQSVAVNSTVVRTTLNLIAGAGLTGGGTLAADRTFNVGAGDGIAVAADSVAVDATVVRTSRSVASGNGLTGGGDLSANRTLSILLPANSGLSVSGSGLIIAATIGGDGLNYASGVMDVDSTVVRTSRTLTAGNGLTGGGDLSANRTFTLGAPSDLSATSANSVSAGTHAHAILAASDVGTSPAASILKSTGAGGLTLAALEIKGSLDITNAGNLYVAGSIGGASGIILTSGDRVGFGRVADPQFTVDVSGPLRADFLIGKHAIQLEDVALLLHWDGGEPFSSNYTGEPNAVPFGQTPSLNQNIHYRPAKFYKGIVMGEAATNLTPNPSFETGLSGWTTNATSSDMTSSQDSSWAHYGAYSAKLTWTTMVSGLSQFHTSFGTYATEVSGADYALGVSLRAAVPMTVRIGLRRSSGAFEYFDFLDVSVTEDWQRFDVVAAVPASAAFRVNISPLTGSANTLWVDGVCVTKSSNPTWYIDGSLGEGYAWTGTANNSTSTRGNGRISYALSQMAVHRWTVMGWIAVPAPTKTDNRIMRFETPNANDRITLYSYPTGLRANITIAGSANFPNEQAINPHEFYHVAFTYDGATCRAFINGQPWASVAGTFTNVPTLVYLGEHAGVYGDVMIDDLCVSRQCLDPDMITAIYESEAPVFAESSVFSFRATPTGLVNADENGLWMRDVSGNAVLGAYGGEAATFSWGGKSLEKGDILFGRYGASDGGWMYFDRDGVSSKPFLSMGYADKEVLALDSGGASLTGVLDISTNGGIYQGSGTFASPTTGLKIWNESGIGRIAGFGGGVNQWSANTDGKLYAGDGKVILDASGLQLITDASTPDASALRFTDGSTKYAELRTQSGAGTNTIGLSVISVAGRSSNLSLTAASPSGKTANIDLSTTVNGISQGGIGIGYMGVNGVVFIQQPSASGATPVLRLIQNDLSEQFIEFTATSGGGNAVNTSALGAYAGRIRISVNGSMFWLPYYS